MANPNRVRVAVVSTDASYLSIVRDLLQGSYEFEDLGNVPRIALVQRLSLPEVVLFDLDEARSERLALAEELAMRGQPPVILGTSRSIDVETLRHAMAVGIRDVLPIPLSVSALREALERGLAAQERRRVARDRSLSRIWTVLAACGGAGATSLALSIAADLAGRNFHVVMVDLDLLFGDVAFYLSMDQGSPHLGDLVRLRDHLDPEVIRQHLKPHPAGFRVLVPPSEIRSALEIPMEAVAQIALATRALADHVIVDLPRGSLESVLPVLDACEHVLVAARPSVSGVKNLRGHLRLFDALGYPTQKVAPVLVGDPGEASTRDFYRRALERVGGEFRQVLPFEATHHEQSVQRGVPATFAFPHSEHAGCVRNLVNSLLGSGGERPDHRVGSSLVARALSTLKG